MQDPATEAYLMVDPHGHTCVMIDRGAAELYSRDHRCTIDELVRRRALHTDDIAANPPGAMALWAWQTNEVI